MIAKTNVKVNLGLNVLRKRPDGFHDLETLFMPCFDFGDTLEIITGDEYSETSASLFARYGTPGIGLGEGPEKDEKGMVSSTEDRRLVQGISSDGKLMVTIARKEGVDWNPLSDLCAKAYCLLAEDFKLPTVKIFLEKTAPVGAGLGGGSADAAFTIRLLNELCALGLDEERMAGYASRLGSDCAVFVYNRPMVGTGRGEILRPYDLDLSGYDLKVLVPEGISVSTKEAYGGIVPREAQDKVFEPLETSLARPVEEWKDHLVNDFEATVFRNHPELEALKRSLYESGAVYACMSGSGSAVFALYRK